MLAHYRDGSGVFFERLAEVNDTSQHPSWGFYEHHFSKSRMGHYLTEFNGDLTKAQLLYEWNGEISAGFWELLAYLEVALRNTIDRQMSTRRLAEGDSQHWLIADKSDLSKLNARLGKDLDEAERRVKQNGKDLTGEQMLSELSFNFWTLMIAKKTMRYWPDLAGGFTGLPGRSPDELSDLLNEVRKFRNRIGHHHRIWNLDLEAMSKKIQRVALFIDPKFSYWLTQKSRVERLLTHRP
jgi:hypothetical protein